MMRLIKSFRKKRAFSLIELIMAIVVVGIVALPVSITLAKHVQSVFVSQDYTTALNLARFDMEQVFNTAYASVSSASFSNYQGYAYNLSRTVTYAYGDAGTPESLKLISVSVTKAGSGVVLVTLKSYIAKNVTLGL
ncbi:MAG: type II secretion system GspH family protein [Candidatus Omnitrophica bacterium]|nr:type II secretion system GspH family protein [Candidatus Omnitrophota bacterium]MBU1923955.1 type II secretion system GspH family protein [Candidatus Omnitrophota bacterium]